MEQVTGRIKTGEDSEMTYDQWKCTDPRDYEDRCDHDDYEVDILDGRCRCACGHSWYASNDQVLAEVERQREYSEYEEQENRRQWWLDLWDRIRSFIPRRKRVVNIDDDIPF